MMKRKAVKGLLELEAAEKRMPRCKFVKSCRSFLTNRGFLSAKQIEALTFAGTPNRRERQFGNPWGGDDFDEHEAYMDFGIEDCDFAGGDP